MTDPVILFVKPKEIRPVDKAALRKAGVVVVECSNPENMKLIRAGTEFTSSGLLEAAMRSINYSGLAKGHFAGQLHKVISDAVLKPAPPAGAAR